MDLTEAEGIKKRWQEYREDCMKTVLYKKKTLYKKVFMPQITMMV